MKTAWKWGLFLLLVCCVSLVQAQEPETIKTEADEPTEDTLAPLDDVVENTTMEDHRVLPYEELREADITWKKRIWRVIDTREKINLAFRYPEMPLFAIIVKGLQEGQIHAYSEENDKFTQRLNFEDVTNKLVKWDTIRRVDPDTYEETYQAVQNEVNFENVKRYRIKELYYFDKEVSRVKVRILGIAPLIESYDDNGNFRFEGPLFWLYYPECRDLFARNNVFIEGNDAAPVSWEDLFEMRMFSSYVYKESNVYDRRIEDVFTAPLDKLMEGENIKGTIFNWEHDLWSY